MIAGLPLESWILILASVGIGLGIELAYLRARRRDRDGSPADPTDGRGAASSWTPEDAS